MLGRIDEFPAANQKDIHGDFGNHCYLNFRHPLCHGWSSGVIAFIVEHILGIKIDERKTSEKMIIFCYMIYVYLNIKTNYKIY